MEIRVLKKPELEKPRMIVGLPGMGMVAKNTVNYLLDSLNPEFFADIYMPFLSPSLAIFNDGLITPMDRDVSPFKFYYSKDENLVIFSGELQFGYGTKDNELANDIIEVAKLCGVDVIYTVTATVIPNYVDKPEIFGVATSAELLKFLSGKGVKMTEKNLQISGVNGLVIEYAWRNGINGISLLSQTAFPDAMDIKACYAGIRKISELLEINIDLSKIENQVRKFEESLEYYMKEIQKKMKKEEDLGYIS